MRAGRGPPLPKHACTKPPPRPVCTRTHSHTSVTPWSTKLANTACPQNSSPRAHSHETCTPSQRTHAHTQCTRLPPVLQASPRPGLTWRTGLRPGEASEGEAHAAQRGCWERAGSHLVPVLSRCRGGLVTAVTDVRSGANSAQRGPGPSPEHRQCCGSITQERTWLLFVF